MNQMCHWGQAPLALVESCYNGSHFQVPKGTDPNGTCKKKYQRGLSPMVSFLGKRVPKGSVPNGTFFNFK